MATLLYFGKDPRIKDMAEAFFKERLTEAGEVNSIMQLTDPKKLDEVFIGLAFDLLLFEQAAFGENPIEGLATFRKRYPRVKAPMVMVGDEKDQARILRYLESGFADYFVQPPDRPLLIEKITLHCGGQRNLSVRQVYSLQLNQVADLAKPGIIEELSEFDCKVRTHAPVPVNELMIVYSNALSEDGSQTSNAVARCYKVEDHPKHAGQFLCSFYFAGVAPDVLTNIRKSLRKTYVSAKTKG
jgi:DNA-binding NarL/FixJ family response regulator